MSGEFIQFKYIFDFICTYGIGKILLICNYLSKEKLISVFNKKKGWSWNDGDVIPTNQNYLGFILADYIVKMIFFFFFVLFHDVYWFFYLFDNYNSIPFIDIFSFVFDFSFFSFFFFFTRTIDFASSGDSNVVQNSFLDSLNLFSSLLSTTNMRAFVLRK